MYDKKKALKLIQEIVALTGKLSAMCNSEETRSCHEAAVRIRKAVRAEEKAFEK